MPLPGSLLYGIWSHFSQELIDLWKKILEILILPAQKCQINWSKQQPKLISGQLQEIMGWRMSKLWLKYVEILIEILFATFLALSIINLYQPDEPTIQMTMDHSCKAIQRQPVSIPPNHIPTKLWVPRLGYTHGVLCQVEQSNGCCLGRISLRSTCAYYWCMTALHVRQESESFRRFANWRWIPNMVISINVHRKSPWKAVSFNKKSEQGHMEEEDPLGMHIFGFHVEFRGCKSFRM